MENGYRVLVIDDSTTYLKILKTYLEREGYGVLTAETGEAGLEQVSKGRPHLILCDYLLPGIKGDEFCKRVKMHSASRHIPIIMLTTRGERKDITTGLEAGADDYVLKSQDFDLLLLRVRNFLSRSRAGGPDIGAAVPALSRHRVLAIDDDPLFLQMICGILGEEGYEVVQAASGEEALEKLAAAPFDLLLVDFVMPGIMGDEVCRRVKADEQTRDIPIILLTGRGAKQDMIAGLNAGADDYIVKSTDIEVLKSRARALIRRKYYQDENRRIQEERKVREIEAARVKAERDAAQDKARMADALAQQNVALEQTNRKLKDAQTALIQAEKMAALGQLVAGIAHEINNPLAFVTNNLVTIERNVRDVIRALSGYREIVGLLGQTVPYATSEAGSLEDELDLETAIGEISTQIANSREGLDRVKNIVISLRNFSRLDEGDVKVVDLSEGVESTLKIIHHLIKDRITIEREYGHMPPVECYPGPLNQVFMNLLVNACQAIREKGVIRIRSFAQDGQIKVMFTDTGCGIPADILPRIFDPFFTTKPVGQGTGLGLSMCYGIMQKHGGQILVDSTPGQGSTFTIVLHEVLPSGSYMMKKENDGEAKTA